MTCASQLDCLYCFTWVCTSQSKKSKSTLWYAGVLHTPASFSDLVLTYKAGNDLPDLLERHIMELAEAEVILRLQVGSLEYCTERSGL